MNRKEDSKTLDEKNEKTILRGHADYVSALTLLSNGYLASGSCDNTIKIWDLAGSNCLATLDGHASSVSTLALLPNRHLASGSCDGKIKIWDVEKRNCLATLDGHGSSAVSAMTLMSNGHLTSGGCDGRIKIWDVEGGNFLVTLEGHASVVSALTLLSNGYFASGSWDNKIKIWDLERRYCFATLEGHGSSVSALTLLPNGDLASGSWDNKIKIWNWKRGDCLATLDGHSSTVYALTLLSNGFLASGSRDTTIKVWDLESRCCVSTVNGHKDCVNALALLSNGFLASASNDHTIKVWDLMLRPSLKPKLVLTFPVEEDAKEMTNTNSGHCDRSIQDELLFTLISLDKVTLIRPLGRGEFGIVYEAEYKPQTEDEPQAVAVKRYHGSELPPTLECQVQHEVSIMQRLDNQYLVHLLGVIQPPNEPPMLVMEYCSRGSLYSYLHSGEVIAWGLRLRMAEELARGLAYLHENQVIHRDIKSVNVVLDRDFHAKWCDFGLACLKEHTQSTFKVSPQETTGTLRWMAPELLSGNESLFSAASDIWAIGMVYFELSSRQIPYKGFPDQVVIFKISQEEAEIVPEACQNQSPMFAKLMVDCWKERTKRPTAAILVERLSEINQSFEERSAENDAKLSVDSGFIALSRR